MPEETTAPQPKKNDAEIKALKKKAQTVQAQRDAVLGQAPASRDRAVLAKARKHIKELKRKMRKLAKER